MPLAVIGEQETAGPVQNICNTNRLANIASVYLANFLRMDMTAFLNYQFNPSRERNYTHITHQGI